MTSKKIAILLTGNLRTLNYNWCKRPQKISEIYKDIALKYNADIFVVCSDTDFYDYIDDCHYFVGNENIKSINDIYSDLSGGTFVYDWRIYKNYKIIPRNEAIPKIKRNLEVLGENLKDFTILDNSENIIDNNNVYHTTFLNDTKSRSQRGKICLLKQFYKKKLVFELMETYEKKNNINYDIIITSRIDCVPIDVVNSVDLNTFKFNNSILTTSVEYHLHDYGAIGDRKTIEIYSNYYKFISPNLLDNVRLYLYYNKNGKIYKFLNSLNIDKSDTEYVSYQDVSDSSEFGLTYLMQKNNIDTICNVVKFDLRRYFN